MSPNLALSAAGLALSAAGSIVSGLASALDPAKAKAKQQADEFETVFLEQMVQHMFAGTQAEGPLGENGAGGDIARSQLTQEYARQIQRAGGIGLSGQILRDLLRLQEQSSASTGAGHASA